VSGETKQNKTKQKKTIMNYIAYFQNMITHYITDSESDAWAFVDDQEQPSDYTIHCVEDDELVNW